MSKIVTSPCFSLKVALLGIIASYSHLLLVLFHLIVAFYHNRSLIY